MGIQVVDYHSLSHFIGGFISFICLKSLGVSDLQNFAAANGIHFLIECLENNKKPNGKILETFENHVGDVFCFAVGWFLSLYASVDAGGYVPYLWCILIYTTVTEIYRELYPYSSSIFHVGAFA